MRHTDDRDLCTFLRERLELFLDGELTGSENLRFQTHLKECEDCAAHWADDEAVSEALLVGVAGELEEESRRAPSATPAPLAPKTVRSITRSRSTWFFPGRQLGPFTVIGTAAAASIMTALLILGLTTRPPVPDSTPVGIVVRLSRGGPLVGESRDGPWRHLGPRSTIADGQWVHVPTGGQLVLDLSVEGALVVGEGSNLLLARSRSGNGTGYDLDLERGDLAVEAGRLEVGVRFADTRVVGALASFHTLVERDEGGGIAHAAVSVTSGFLRAEHEADFWSIGPGNSYVVGAVVVDDVPPLAGVESPVEDSVVAALRRELETITDENRDLRQRLLHIERAAVLRGTPATPGAVVEDLYTWVDMADDVRHDRPNPYLLIAIEQLRGFGDAGVEVVARANANEPKALRRRALAVLLGGIATPGATDVLLRMARDEKREVREAALHWLDQREAPGLAREFLELHELETDGVLRCFAAFYASRRSEAGIDALIRCFDHPSPGGWDRAAVIRRLAFLDGGDGVILPFLRSILDQWDGTQPEEVLLSAIATLADRGDAQALPALRAMAVHCGISATVRDAVEVALIAIESP